MVSEEPERRKALLKNQRFGMVPWDTVLERACQDSPAEPGSVRSRGRTKSANLRERLFFANHRADVVSPGIRLEVAAAPEAAV